MTAQTDSKAIRDSFAEDAVWTLHAGELPISGTWAGRDAILDDILAGACCYENGCIGVFTIEDGKIRSVREYMDTLYAYERAFAADVPSA